MSNPLADAVHGVAAAIPRQLRVGVVDGTSPLTITLAGQDGIEAYKAASYTSPSVDDVVLVFVNESDFAVICKLVPG